MSSTPPAGSTDLHNIYCDLALALGTEAHRAGTDDAAAQRYAAVHSHVQQLWARTVQQLGSRMSAADRVGVPPVVQPDPAAPADLDVDMVLEAVASYRPPTDAGAGVGRAPRLLPVSVRTAALVWCAAATVLAVVLGLTTPINLGAVPLFLIPIATVLLVAWRGAGGVRGFFYAIGLAPLALVPGAAGVAVAALAIVVLVEGFAYITYLSSAVDGSWEDDPRAQRRPLEIELAVYSLAAATIRVDMVGLLVIACLAGFLWRRRWTAALAAALTCLAWFVQQRSAGGADVVVYLVLAGHWARAVFHRPWLAGRMSLTEVGISLSGWALRGTWRAARRAADNVLPPLGAASGSGLLSGLTSREAGTRTPGGGSFGLRYCNTCLTSTEHDKAGFSQPVCRRCLGKAGRRGDRDATFRQTCGTCRGPTQHTDSGKCLNCWRKGR
ncbi:MAG: hypothetical protein ACRDRK_21965 [Pseudonocardia sp.]